MNGKGLTAKQQEQALKREAAKRKKEEEQAAKKLETEAKKEKQKISRGRFTMCTKVGGPMAMAHKQAMDVLEKAKKKQLEGTAEYKDVEDMATVIGQWKDKAAKALAWYTTHPDGELQPLPFTDAKEAQDKIKDLQFAVKIVKDKMTTKKAKTAEAPQEAQNGA